MDDASTDRTATSGSEAVGIVRLGFALAGTTLIGVGGFMQYPPLGFAAAGALLYGIAVLGEVRAKR